MRADHMSEKANENWRLKLLGRPALRLGDGEAVDLPKKAFVIATRLILDCTQAKSARAELGAFLWPEFGRSTPAGGLADIAEKNPASPAGAREPALPHRGRFGLARARQGGLRPRRRRPAAEAGRPADVVASLPQLKEELLEGFDGRQREPGMVGPATRMAASGVCAGRDDGRRARRPRWPAAGPRSRRTGNSAQRSHRRLRPPRHAEIAANSRRREGTARGIRLSRRAGGARLRRSAVEQRAV